MRDPSAKLADPNLSLTELATTIDDLWFALNNCYTLNPRHRDEQRGKTQLDQVADPQLQILHPTIPGYAAIADVVLGALGRSVKTDKAAAHAADTLLNDVKGPPLLVAQAELSLLGLLGVFRGGGAAAV
ncbi:MAG TPA: hypothetical protein VIY55_07140 [Acetobacteraceae bacterium]